MTARGSITVQTSGDNASLYADAQQCSAWLTRAEGPVKLPSVVANAIVFYKTAVAKCLTCQAGERCSVHGTAALRPPAERPDVDYDAVRRVTQAYFACFTEARGARPTFTDRDGAAVKQLIRVAGTDRAEQAIRNAFSDTYWKGKATISTIASDPSRHLGDSKIAAKGSLQADSGYESAAREVR
jgi:hypothetical protein